MLKKQHVSIGDLLRSPAKVLGFETRHHRVVLFDAHRVGFKQMGPGSEVNTTARGGRFPKALRRRLPEKRRSRQPTATRPPTRANSQEHARTSALAHLHECTCACASTLAQAHLHECARTNALARAHLHERTCTSKLAGADLHVRALAHSHLHGRKIARARLREKLCTRQPGDLR